MAAILSRPQYGIDLCLLCYVSDCNPRVFPLQWHHNGHNIVSNHQPRVCLLNRLFRRRSKKTSKIRVPGLCTGNSPVTGEFPAQMASNAENVSIWWRHHATTDMQRHILSYPWRAELWSGSIKYIQTSIVSRKRRGDGTWDIGAARKPQLLYGSTARSLI